MSKNPQATIESQKVKIKELQDRITTLEIQRDDKSELIEKYRAAESFNVKQFSSLQEDYCKVCLAFKQVQDNVSLVAESLSLSGINISFVNKSTFRTDKPTTEPVDLSVMSMSMCRPQPAPESLSLVNRQD